MAKSAQRLEARRLRRQGESIIVIAKKLDVSKGSVSLWCNDIRLTKKQVANLLKRPNLYKLGQHIAAQKNRLERIDRMTRFAHLGEKRVGKLSKRELFLVGAALYWAEGAKKNRRIMLANSDPSMINLFIRWLKESCNVSSEDIYCNVSINQDHEKRIDEVEEYWSKVTGISRKVFTKVSYKKVKNKKFYANFNNHYGTLFVKARRGTNLNYEILGFIEGIKQNVSSFGKIHVKAG